MEFSYANDYLSYIDGNPRCKDVASDNRVA